MQNAAAVDQPASSQVARNLAAATVIFSGELWWAIPHLFLHASFIGCGQLVFASASLLFC